MITRNKHIKKGYRKACLGLGLFLLSLPVGAQQVADTAKVNVAFGTKAKSELMGGVSAIDMVDLTDKNFDTSIQNNLSAYVSGIQDGSFLVLVDGVPRDDNNVLPSEVAQVTFLKSAAAVALYGSRAAKGAILITTKRGHNDGLKVTVRGNASTFVPKEYPTYLGAAQYMSLYNEARKNDGLSASFTDEQIYNYASGKNPYRYPDVNFFSKDYLKKSYQRYDGNIELEGGGKFAHFYSNIGYYHIGDLINFGEGKDNYTSRLNVRGNIDMRLNDWISGFVNANATFYDQRRDAAYFWSQSATLRQVEEFPLTPLIPIEYVNPAVGSIQDYIKNSNYVIDGKYLLGGTQAHNTNPFAGMYAGGYETSTSRQLQFDAGFNFDLNKVLEGLKFSTQMAIDYKGKYLTSLTPDNYATYEATWSNMNGKDEIIGLTKYKNDERDGTPKISNSSHTQTTFFSAQFDYTREFGDHNLAATLLAHGYQINNSGEYHHVSNANLGLDINYNFAKKYYADLTLAAIHSARLAEGHREAINPVVSLAWDLKKEDFLKDTKWLSGLKLNTSYGVLNEDLDIADYYMYDAIFTATGTWWGWSESANAMQTSDSQRAVNNDLDFIKRKEFRIGLDANLWDGLIKLNANYTHLNIEGLITTPEAIYPSYMHTYYPVSSYIPNINYNNQSRDAFDFQIDAHKNFGELDATLGVTGMYVTAKNTKVSELAEYDYQKSEGQSTSAIWGYKCLGFFQDAEDVANSPKINNTTKPGDLKYQNMNGDDKIDSKDMVVLGQWNPDFYLGMNLTLKYKGFTFFMNGTANFGGMGVKNNSYEWCYGDSRYSDVVLGRWTPETAATATYPRLTTQGSELNFVTSDFWTYSTNAFRLNKVQLTYDLPSKLFDGKWLNGASVYVSGTSLLTIAKERKYMETNVGASPQCRGYNLGVKVNF